VIGLGETAFARRAASGMKRRGLVTLWVIVTALWTVATWLRVNRVWLPVMDWPEIWSSGFTWLSLLLPPAAFGAILFAVGWYEARTARR